MLAKTKQYIYRKLKQLKVINDSRKLDEMTEANLAKTDLEERHYQELQVGD